MADTIQYFDEDDTMQLILLIKGELDKYAKKTDTTKVSVNSEFTEGTKLATITVDDVPTDIYSDFTAALKTKLNGIAEEATKTSIEQIQTTGNTIAKITINGVETEIKVAASQVIVVDTAMSDTSENPVQNKVIKSYVDGKVSTVYRVKGSIPFASIPTTDMFTGDVYDISDAFTTDARFVEGAGKVYPAGTNIVWTADSKWDVLAGAVDVSGFVLKDDLKAITPAEVETWWKEQFPTA